MARGRDGQTLLLTLPDTGVSGATLSSAGVQQLPAGELGFRQLVATLRAGSGAFFVDSDFDLSAPAQNTTEHALEWLRPSELVAAPSAWGAMKGGGEEEEGDLVKQGEIGDCWCVLRTGGGTRGRRGTSAWGDRASTRRTARCGH